MKKILSMVAVATILATSSFALQSKYFVYNKQHKTLGGAIGHTMIVIYKVKNVAQFRSKHDLHLLTKLGQNIVCKKEDTRNAIMKHKYNVFFIYVNKSISRSIVVNINSCARVPAP